HVVFGTDPLTGKSTMSPDAEATFYSISEADSVRALGEEITPAFLTPPWSRPGRRYMFRPWWLTALSTRSSARISLRSYSTHYYLDYARIPPHLRWNAEFRPHHFSFRSGVSALFDLPFSCMSLR